MRHSANARTDEEEEEEEEEVEGLSQSPRAAKWLEYFLAISVEFTNMWHLFPLVRVRTG